MQLQWTSILIILFERLLFSIGLCSVAKKLGWEKPWYDDRSSKTKKTEAFEENQNAFFNDYE